VSSLYFRYANGTKLILTRKGTMEQSARLAMNITCTSLQNNPPTIMLGLKIECNSCHCVDETFV
jgi:hypothetical protein